VGVPPEEVQHLVEELLPRQQCMKKGQRHVKGWRQLQRAGMGTREEGLAVDLVLREIENGGGDGLGE
jgi:hypothetical protein